MPENQQDAAGSSGMEEDFASLFEQSEARAVHRPKIEVGQLVRGRVVVVGQNTAFIEIGEKGEAQIDLSEFRDPATGAPTIAEGDLIEATVTDDGSTSGAIVLKQSVGKGGHLPGELEQAFELGLPVEGLVAAENKGGFDIQIGTVRAFCPRSQIDRKRGEMIAADYLDKRFSFRITKVDHKSRDVVVSRRALLETEAAERAQRAWASIEPGAVIDGTVTSIQPFGAFVDLGGVEGMVHISQLAYGRVDHPSSVLDIGQAVQVKVIKVETRPDGRRQIGLSMRELAADPWIDVQSEFPAGSTFLGIVRRLEPFGAFVELKPGLEGLAHISKISLERRLSHARQALDIGQEVDVTVLAVEPEKRRISLSLVEGQRQEKAASEARDRADEQTAMAVQNRPQSLGSLAELLRKAGPKD